MNPRPAATPAISGGAAIKGVVADTPTDLTVLDSVTGDAPSDRTLQLAAT